MEFMSTLPCSVIIVGDFNVHVDNPNDLNSRRFLSIVDIHGMTQHIRQSTHAKCHTLDLVITRDEETCITQPHVFDPCICNDHGHITTDHLAIRFELDISKPKPKQKQVSFRRYTDINMDDMGRDLSSITPNLDASLYELVATYNNSLETMMDKLPLIHI